MLSNNKFTADRFIDNRVAVNDGAPPEGGGVGAIAAAPIFSAPAEPAAFTGRDDRFTGNSTAAGGWRGAIYVGAPAPDCPPGPGCPGSTITLDDSTVVGNHVDAGVGSEGSALWGSLHDMVTVNNSIIFGNAPKPEISWFGSHPPVFAYSDVCTESGGPTVSGAGNICKDPKLKADGAETLGVSPTIAKGSVVLVPAGLSTDLAGHSRVTPDFSCKGKRLPPHVDMGAFEALIPRPFCPAHSNVILLSTQLADKHGKAAVKLRCRKAPCVGTLTILHRRLNLGHAHFRIRVAERFRVEVKLSAGALAKLGTKSPAAVTITLRHAATQAKFPATLKLPSDAPERRTAYAATNIRSSFFGGSAGGRWPPLRLDSYEVWKTTQELPTVCAESSATLVPGRLGRSCWRDSRSSNTAATTAPGSPSWSATASTRCGRWAT